MIVMLALLNDGAILSIAYDNVHYKNAPEAWNMRVVLGIASVLGVLGPIAAFGLFFLGDRVFHLDRPHLQPMMYLMLSVAGHLTIFLTRTRGPFWSIRPAKILWMAVLGTQIVATLIAVYGFLMPPLGWKWAGFVWVYALAWFFFTDPVKLLAYRILDPVKKAGTKLGTKVETQPEAKTDPKPDAKPGVKPEVKAEPKPDDKAEAKPDTKVEPKLEAETESKPDVKAEAEAKPAVERKPGTKEVGSKPEAEAESDLKPQIAKRAYELYEARGRKGDSADQDWEKAEREIRKDKAGAEAKPPSDVSPQLVERVHKLYEDLGREDVRAVEAFEKAEQEAHEDELQK